uniref:F-actin monooxygenase n=1 Tax=Oncorhynchus kisutch TaxID=8019 RepID=A0A8C7G1G4_ONCKI
MEFPGCPAAAGVAVGDEAEKEGHAQVLFDEFVQASTCRTTLRAFNLLCEHLQLTHTHTQPQTYSPTQPQRPFYHSLKERLSYWKANALWAKLDKRAAHHEYGKGRVCANTTCVIIGAGPCGLRTAVELGFLGARVVLLEKRDAFSRNNVLHLWPFTIHDLRGLGAKKFYGKFCAGAIDHISEESSLSLYHVALLLGVEVHVNVEFKGLVEPPVDQEQQKVGWRVEVKPKSHPINQLQCDVVIGADGRRNTLPGFRRKEFRGKLAIAITANFMNRNTTAEAKVEEISGVAFIFNQRFFQELRDTTGVDLENIVYYKDDTHYFVMTAKKQSLLEKGVILRDYADTETLLSRGNVDQNALLAYAREAADFSTNHQLPSLDFAMNHYGQPDVALFDFTCMYASENAALVRQRHGHHLLVTLVGDSLLEPFWPMGTGIARGFLAALDSAWMVRSWAQGLAPLDILAERESLYRLLPQASPENVNKNFGQYTVDPATRYPNINHQLITPAQVGHLIYTEESGGSGADQEPRLRSPLPKLLRQESFSRSSKLLSWCQQQTQGYRGVAVSDLTTSWKNGLALCALIHHYRPDLIDFDSLKEDEGEENMRLGLEVAEKEFGISPVMTVEEMSSVSETDTLCMVMYLSQFHQLFKDALPPSGEFLNHSKAALCSVGGASQSRVRSMANQLLAKFEENAPCPSSTPAAALRRQVRGDGIQRGASDVCFFCSRRVYVMERLSAEGLFFHRSCFQCDHCSSTLRLASYAYDRPNGKFYCKPHYDLRLVGPVQRKRPAPPTSDQHPTPYERTPSQQTLLVRTSRECGLAKRVRGTPERIELENYCGSLGSLETEQLTDEPEEVPEETLANYNLSLLVTEVKKANHKRISLRDNEGSSSESETEEEGERQRALTNDLARDSWRKAMELHARLRGERGDDEEETEEGEEEGEVDEDDDDDEEELSSDGNWPFFSVFLLGWEDTKIPLGREPLPRKSRGGLDPRRLTESLPPLLLTQLQGGSLFPSRKCCRDNQPSSQSVSEAGIGEGGPLGLWRAVISGYKRDRKKKGRTSLSKVATAPAPKEQGRRKPSAERRGNTHTQSGDLFRERQSWSEPEESDITCSVVMERCSMNPKANSAYVPHALAFKRAYAIKVEEQLDARLTRRVQRAARKQAKQEQLKRLHRAQMIQRQLEQVEEKQRQLEERGVAVEKALRGEADYWGESNDSEELDLHLGVMGRQDDPALMQQWFKLVQQKNCLMRYESELMIFARELELEDRQSRLQQELRERMAVDDHLKGEAELAEEKLILGEMLEVVEQRDALVSLLEEQRLQESQEDRDLEAIMLSRGLGLHNWA